MSSKDKIISKTYHEFYGSVNSTYADARKIDKTITLKDVKAWFDKSFVRKKNLKGFNSYIAQHPHEEYQMDLFFINDLDDQEYRHRFADDRYLLKIHDGSSAEIEADGGSTGRDKGSLSKYG
jgi:hypothetical protein